jgi:hypothetical protein
MAGLNHINGSSNSQAYSMLLVVKISILNHFEQEKSENNALTLLDE